MIEIKRLLKTLFWWQLNSFLFLFFSLARNNRRYLAHTFHIERENVSLYLIQLVAYIQRKVTILTHFVFWKINVIESSLLTTLFFGEFIMIGQSLKLFKLIKLFLFQSIVVGLSNYMSINWYLLVCTSLRSSFCAKFIG